MTDTRIGPKNAFLHGGEHPLTRCHVGAADEDRGVVQVLRAAREDRAVHQIAHGVLRHAAVAHDLVGAAVEATTRSKTLG